MAALVALTMDEMAVWLKLTPVLRAVAMGGCNVQGYTAVGPSSTITSGAMAAGCAPACPTRTSTIRSGRVRLIENGRAARQGADAHLPGSSSATAAAAALSPDDELCYGASRQKYSFKRRRSPFGVVYKDGKPIGILEPISRIFEYETFPDEFGPRDSPSKRSNVESPAGGEDALGKPEPDDSLRSFRMNAHIHEPPAVAADEGKRDAKRSPPAGSEDVKAPLQGGQQTKLSAIESNLKEIISDLNTIGVDADEAADADGAEEELDGGGGGGDDGVDKREAQMEDEDLDDGANRIGLTKETHPKRVGAETTSIKEKKSTDANAARAAKEVADYRGEGESFIRRKRQQASAAKQEVNDIVKGLETSGDLTVSGNKSPLASASAPVEAEGKKAKGGDFEKREKQTDDGEYEKRLQRNIKKKINQIKDQVKREIQALNADGKPLEFANAPKLGGDAGAKQEGGAPSNVQRLHEPEQKVRQKRNLLEQQTSELGLAQNTGPDALVGHVRQKRSAEGAEGAEGDRAAAKDEDDARANALRRAVRQAKRDAPPGFGPDPGRGAASANAPPTQSRAPATTDLKRAVTVASGGMDAERLERLLKESASLTESIKNERDARRQGGGTHVDVELLGPADRAGSGSNPAEESGAAGDADEGKAEIEVRDREEGAGKALAVAKRDVKRKATCRQVEAPNDSPTKIEEIEPASDCSPTPAASRSHHKFKAYESSTKLVPSIEETFQSPTKAVEMRTESPTDGFRWSGDAERSDLPSEARPDAAKLREDADGKSSEDGDLGKREAAPKQASKVRQERQSLPMLSLEEMQALDSENSMRRRRRYAAEYDDYSLRGKRGDYDAPSMHFRNYRADEDEADDESDEFDDDNFDDRTANLVRKRAAAQGLDGYDGLDDEYGPPRVNKRNANARDYVAQMNSDAYDSANYLYDANGRALNRNKRQIVDDGGAAHLAPMAALHGGGPMTRHLAAIRSRNAHAGSDDRAKIKKNDRSLKGAAAKGNQMISGLSESDIFGALPQSYEGELTRFKRVKRDDPAG